MIYHTMAFKKDLEFHPTIKCSIASSPFLILLPLAHWLPGIMRVSMAVTIIVTCLINCIIPLASAWALIRNNICKYNNEHYNRPNFHGP